MIHRFENNGYYILLDVHSGAVHVVDKLAYDIAGLLTPDMAPACPQTILDALSADYPAQDIRETYDELYGLYADGLLFSPDDYEQFADRMVSSPLKAMCLHVSHDCNLRCQYCFAGAGRLRRRPQGDEPAGRQGCHRFPRGKIGRPAQS